MCVCRLDNNPISVWPFCHKLHKNGEAEKALPARAWLHFQHTNDVFQSVPLQRCPDTTGNGAVPVVLVRAAGGTLTLQLFEVKLPKSGLTAELIIANEKPKQRDNYENGSHV